MYKCLESLRIVSIRTQEPASMIGRYSLACIVTCIDGEAHQTLEFASSSPSDLSKFGEDDDLETRVDVEV